MREKNQKGIEENKSIWKEEEEEDLDLKPVRGRSVKGAIQDEN